MMVETIISGFASKIISDGLDISKSAIKNELENVNANHTNVQSQIYHIIICALDETTNNKYKNSRDKIYDAAERILDGFKRGESDYIKVAISGLQLVMRNADHEKCEEFIRLIYSYISKEEYFALYKEVLLIILEQQSKYNQRELQQIKEIINSVNDTLDKNNIADVEKGKWKYEHTEDMIKCRTHEYADKWNENMFLNNFNKRDEKAGVNIKLRDVYSEEFLPWFIWRNNIEPSNDLKNVLAEYILEIDKKKMLLILGQPGIGKSTLITWITSNFANILEDILVYQFANDMKNVCWEEKNILDEVLSALNLSIYRLEGKILILDGFDEVSVDGNREEILNHMYQGLKRLNMIKKLSIIVTCRENYVYELEKVECNYIILQAWTCGQIQSFCSIYARKNMSRVSKGTINKVLENREIFGIPLILYMVLALNISIEEKSSIVDVYDQIFSLDGGSIYDRCIRNSRFADPHRISETKQLIHQISKKIAFWIFENNSENESIPQENYERICNSVIDETKNVSKQVKRDSLIGNYFNLVKHCEADGTGRLHFVHRSIYEYFVAEHMLSSCNRLSRIMDAGELGKLLKDGNLSGQILDFVKYKFENTISGEMSSTINETFRIMLRDGMTYHTNEIYKNVIDKEINIFSNMLKLIHLWNHVLGEVDGKIVYYLKFNNRTKLNLKGIKLGSVDLSRVYLDGANLIEAVLYGTKLEKAELNGAKLREANLNGADLKEAHLNGADLIGAYLQGASLNGARLEKADLSGADLIGTKLIKANLNGADLIGTKLIKADLSGAELNEADLSRAELNGADFRGAELNGIKLDGAYLRDAIFDDKQIEVLSPKYDMSSSKVYNSMTKETMSYEEYYKRS